MTGVIITREQKDIDTQRDYVTTDPEVRVMSLHAKGGQ